MGRNTLKLNLKGFERLLTDLDKLGGDLKPVVTDALSQAGETIGDDTYDAVGAGNLPASGKYSSGDTRHAVVRAPQVKWSGTLASIGVGFDYNKSGAGGYLISGTPRMRPVSQLQDIYKRKRYMSQIQKDMADIVMDAIAERLGR